MLYSNYNSHILKVILSSLLDQGRREFWNFIERLLADRQTTFASDLSDNTYLPSLKMSHCKVCSRRDVRCEQKNRS
jgi:hypothetical protein